MKRRNIGEPVEDVKDGDALSLNNVLSVDLESWLHFYDEIEATKEMDAGLTAHAVRLLLSTFSEFGVKTTFFVVGEVAEWYPDLLEEIQSLGHEIGFHTYAHGTYKPRNLRSDLEESELFLNQYKPIGFRAPKINIERKELELLREYGFLYDSSIYAPFTASCFVDGIIEFPVSTYPPRKVQLDFPRTFSHALGNFEIPFGSALFFAVLPERIISSIITRLNAVGQPATIFIHPWQVIKVPRFSSRFLEMVRKFPYMRGVSINRIRRLLRTHYFGPMCALLKYYDVS